MDSEKQAEAKALDWRLTAAIVLAGAIAAAYFQLTAESNFRFPFTLLSVFLTLIVLGLRWLAFGGMSVRMRAAIALGALFLFIGGIAFLKFTTRIDGSFSGAGVPRLVWKWTPKTDANLGAIAAPALPQGKLLLVSTADDSPQFLGASRRGTLDIARFGRNWNAKPPKELWRLPVGVGWSSFAVVSSYAITQEQRGELEMTVCYDVVTGKVQWEHSQKVRFTEAMGGDGPRATPTVADGHVYVLGATGILDCLDAATGSLVWSHDTLVENQIKNITWGKSSSPLVYDDVVVVTGGENEGPSLLAYNRNTGALAWKNGHDKSGYGSPVLTTLAGREQITLVNARSVSGHSRLDGALLWEYKWPGDWPKSSQTVNVGGDCIFISAGYGTGCSLVKISKTDTGFTATELWKNKSLKAPYSNVVLRNGFLYGIDDETLACAEVATGQRRWKEGHAGHGQVLLAGDLLLIQTEPGDVVLAEANPEKYVELARIPALSSKTWNVPVLSGRHLLVRNDREAVCYELPEP